ncbi:MAG: hypothetical protein OQL09_00830, partial [Gammaproteobacteria bacterium]|nr:hypothetical protein [Gammaproteobacteria bacterium]
MPTIKKLLPLILVFISFNTHAINPRLDWKTIESDHFYVHFAQGYLSQARQVASIAEAVHEKLVPLIHWQPQQKTHLAISDETDQPNGYAISFPFNRSVLFLSPPDEANSLEDVENWLETLIEHEYTHILHIDKASGGPNNLRSIFGRNIFLFPNQFQPAWLIEGLATYIETHHDTGIGRGQSSLFRMMMREEVRHGIKPVDQVNLPMRRWPMGSSAYLYGVYFFQFLQQQYGQQYIDRLIENYSNNLLPFFINSNADSVFGKDLKQLWQEFDDWLKQEFAAELVQTSGTDKQLSQHGYFTRELEISDDGRLYYVRGGGEDHPALMMIDEAGVQQHLININYGARINLHPDQNRLLVTQPEFCNEYEVYFDIYEYNIKKNELKRLTECGRYRSAAWLDGGESMLAIKTVKGRSEIHRLDRQGKYLETLYASDAGVILSQPAWSEQIKYMVMSVFRPGKGWNIELFNPENKKWMQLTDDQYVDMYPVFIHQGQQILFSSDVNGQYNIHQINVNGTNRQQLTEVPAGAFYSAYNEQTRQLYYQGYHGNGYDVFKSGQLELTKVTIKSRNSIKQSNQDQSDSVSYTVTDYSPWSSLVPKWWLPVFSVTEQETILGATGSGNDALGIHNYSYLAAYDTLNDYVQGEFIYVFSSNLAFGVRREGVKLLDSNDELGIIRNDDDIYLLGQLNFPSMNSIWNIQVGAISSEQSDYYVASGILPLADRRDRILGASVYFSNVENYILSVSESDGIRARLTAESSDVWDSDYTGEVYSLNLSGYIDFTSEHVLALQYVHAVSNEQPEPFRLGGEDSDFNFLDVLTPITTAVFGRREYSLRGYAEGHAELQGNNMQLASMEWRFPINRVERGFMAPPIGLMQLSGSVFAESGGVWDDGNQPETFYNSIGAELHADVNLFYGLTTKLRMGYAKGLDKLIGDDRFYFSLG